MVESTQEEQSRTLKTELHEEVEKRYLAYALSTIVSRALPDVRDGLKPVHRRILYAMHSMGLGETARMRKSAAVVGEVIGKYHPHGDQAAYDALVRMAQDFSLRYPMVAGSGNFGSLDGDSPAAMRYTESKLSGFAGLLLRELDQGTTDFSPTYDGMGEEPDVLPTAVPNLLLNGSSGIAVGMSCSFPPHNLAEVIAACRAAIADPKLDTSGMLDHMGGPDFPTGGEIISNRAEREEVYGKGHGALRVRGTYEIEYGKRGKTDIVITSIPYSVNKSRLVERIAQLVKDKKLKHVYDIRDESTDRVRIVLELKGATVGPETIMAFVYKHTELQINFPINFIAITPEGVPERLSLESLVRHFITYRYETTRRRLEHRLAFLRKRIHLLEGFEILFSDLDRALEIIRSAKSRKEASDGLKAEFKLDDEQTDAILEMRLYRLVALEIDKLLEELESKRKEAAGIEKDLASPTRMWKLVDKELEEIAKKFGDERRTVIIDETIAAATEYDPDQFVEHEDATVILSRQGWLRRIKAEVEDVSSLKFREGDGPMTAVRVNTERTTAFFSNLGKVYVMRVLDVPTGGGFGEPLGSIFTMSDGEYVVGVIAPDVVRASTVPEPVQKEPAVDREDEGDESDQPSLFPIARTPAEKPESQETVLPTGVEFGIVATRGAKGFRFEPDMLREPTKRAGRRLINLAKGDEVLVAKTVDRELILAASDGGNMLLFPADQVPVLQGPGQGVRLMRLDEKRTLVALEPVGEDDTAIVEPVRGKERPIMIRKLVTANRAGKGKREVASGIRSLVRADRTKEQ